MKTENQNFQVTTYYLNDDGVYPNSNLPVLFYHEAIKVSKENGAAEMEKLFRKNKWKSAWREGIYHFHHYHSTAHEALGVYSGRAKVQIGGQQGIEIRLNPGDVLLLPAGVAHKSSESTDDFRCVGAYPPGQNFDINYGDSDERPKADNNIKKVSLPKSDPVGGLKGGIIDFWLKGRPKSRKVRTA